ncbi:hypothetical protein PUN28_011454 [Cardiocondyla obscurior]|uniref:Uncharacterized protein n=1 Tax=Cardiocondyla obscurior TaxID=286306 RepID=A0AAW2FJC6_9HYME
MPGRRSRYIDRALEETLSGDFGRRRKFFYTGVLQNALERRERKGRWVNAKREQASFRLLLRMDRELLFHFFNRR